MRLSCSEQELSQLAAALSCIVRREDVVTLHGDLGAGKTTFSRYLISALLGYEEEIPSPTFSLVQTYEASRMAVAHFDLYRLGEAAELYDLGFEDAIAEGLVLVEWPERARHLMPDARLEIHLHETDDPLVRDVELIGRGDWEPRLQRFEARQEFLKINGWANADIGYMQGDASVRAYARLERADARCILMDAPAMSDGPVLRDGKSYSTIAHLAEDVRPFVAVGTTLHQAGFAIPQIYAADLERGFLLLEDLGPRVFGAELEAGAAQGALWCKGVDVLLALRQVPVPSELPLPGTSGYELPCYDVDAMQIEVELLVDWYWPMVHGKQMSNQERDAFLALWQPLFERLATGVEHWVLRDFHSPNLLYLPERTPPANVGIIDFQDAMRGPGAYDLVSLLQDARVDVPALLERELFAHYCTGAQRMDAQFDPKAFAFDYAAMGAQRNVKILGIFARLARRDGKPQYLAHMPRIRDYLIRNLEHPELTGLKEWFERHFPPELRSVQE